MRVRNLLTKSALEGLLIVISLIYLAPFAFVVINSMKPAREILLNPSALPLTLYFDNYLNVTEALNFGKAFMNSLIITSSSIVCLVVFGSMAAYRMVRYNSKLNRFLFLLFVSSMVIPFQSIMISMVKVFGNLGWINTYYGILFFAYLGFGVPFTVFFLFHGFIKTIPFSLEEAAVIDGCSPLGVFWRIVFPLLKPITVTVIILDSLWIWNDFLLPLLIIPAEEMRTIPLAINTLFSMYSKQWDLAMAGLIIAIIPVVILFLSLQKYIINGIVSGAVKG